MFQILLLGSPRVITPIPDTALVDKDGNYLRDKNGAILYSKP